MNLAYEIEGLLMLHINRGDEASPEMKELLVGKAQRLLDGLTADTENEDGQTDAPAEQAVPAYVEPESVVAEEPAVVSAEKTEQETVPVPEIAPEPESESESVTAPVEPEQDAIAVSAQFEEKEDACGTAPQCLTLDEKLARERAADISKAFTLNDKFRFRRDLFRNSEEEFKETLDVIGSMADMDEAEDYFYNDLCWDPEKDEVKEFMAIVAKHF